ncbi:hypothetical protein D3C87_1258800 [compost metagenome]
MATLTISVNNRSTTRAVALASCWLLAATLASHAVTLRCDIHQPRLATIANQAATKPSVTWRTSRKLCRLLRLDCGGGPLAILPAETGGFIAYSNVTSPGWRPQLGGRCSSMASSLRSLRSSAFESRRFLGAPASTPRIAIVFGACPAPPSSVSTLKSFRAHRWSRSSPWLANQAQHLSSAASAARLR